jgi:hypothetical protein
MSPNGNSWRSQQSATSAGSMMQSQYSAAHSVYSQPQSQYSAAPSMYSQPQFAVTNPVFVPGLGTLSPLAGNSMAMPMPMFPPRAPQYSAQRPESAASFNRERLSEMSNPMAVPSGLPRAVALFEFRAENADELDLEAGDRLKVVQLTDDGDWAVVKKEASGLLGCVGCRCGGGGGRERRTDRRAQAGAGVIPGA